MFSESRNNRHHCIGDSQLPQDRDNDAGIGDNSGEIGNNSILMLNSILNGDWSNSVPGSGRQIPEGPTPLTQKNILECSGIFKYRQEYLLCNL